MNTNSSYPWTRFWCPRGKPIIADRAGYLLDPESSDGRLLLPYVVPFEKIEHLPCVILLGEPGLGKSTTIAAYQDAARKNLAPGEQLLYVDFRYDREPDKSLFDSPEFSGWLKGSHPLQLFIDSLDECSHRDVAQQLYGKVRRGPIGTLKLRIACRTAELPHVINQDVASLWSTAPGGEERHGFFELAPLRLKDVELAAGKATSAFLAEVSRKGAAALAGRPITLGLLLQLYARDGSLPRTRWELYEQGSGHLCEELSGTRRDSGQLGKLDSEERLAIASRIGAVSILGQRSVVQVAPGVPAAPDRTLAVRDLVGGQERLSRREVAVSTEAVHEVLRTALFSGLGSPHERGWAHQTYAEFLAARFLHARALSVEDLGGILIARDQGGRVVPSLREVAAWLASIDASLRDHLLLVDPQVLLRSDSAIVGDVEREQLVEALLTRADALELPDHTFQAYTDYPKLAHHGLVKQLERWLRDRHRHLVARRMAIDIAEACGVSKLEGLLVEIALDGTEEHAVRVEAAHAVLKVGSEEARQRLLPLVNSTAAEDPDDELRGHALSALWPAHISAGDLFSLLQPPRQERFIGRYHMFLRHELNKGLADSSLPIALAWAASVRRSYPPAMDPIVRAADVIIRRAADHIHQPEILSALVTIARARFEQYQPLFTKDHDPFERDSSPDGMEVIRCESSLRRRFVDTFVSSTSPMNDEYFRLAHYQLLGSSDLEWLIEKVESEGDTKNLKRWLDIVSELVLRNELTVENTEALIDAVERNSDLRRALAWWYEPVETTSSVAEQLRSQQRALQDTIAKIRSMDRQPPPLDPLPQERVKDRLERFEAGDMRWFEHVQIEMSLEPTSTHYYPEWGPDLTHLPGWAAADDATRDRIVGASKRFIQNGVPRSPASLAERLVPFSAVAEYRPFYLMMRLDPGWLDSLPTSAWQRFAPVIIGYHITGGERAIHSALVERAYHRAPAETLWALCILLGKDNTQHGTPFVLGSIAHCWDDQLNDLLVLKAHDPALKPTFLAALLGELLDHRVAAAKQLAVSLIQLPIPSEASARARALAAGEALLKHGLADAWEDLWLVLDKAPDFGRELFLQAAEHLYRDAQTWGSGLPEMVVADLYIWLGRVFPESEDIDPITKKSVEVTARETVGEMRSALLRSLTARGTSESLRAIEAIRQAFPENTVLAFTRILAVESTLQAAWVPLRPDQVIDLQPAQRAPLPAQAAPPSEVARTQAKEESMKLQGEQVRALREALLDAFRTQDELRQMLREETNRNLDAIALGTSLSVVVSKVIEDADARGWIGALVDGARKANPNNSMLASIACSILANHVTAESTDSLERIVRARSPFIRLEEFLDFLAASKRRICRVETRSGDPIGTAFLVGPDVVLTNHHVVSTDVGTDSPNLQLRFDYLTGTDGARATTGRIYQLVRRNMSSGRDWLLAAGPPSAGDFKDDGSAPQPGELDFALLRVDGAPGREQVDGAARGWVELPAAPVESRPDDIVAILQHADGNPLRIAVDTIQEINSGRTRVRYRATTLKGASGAPCFSLTRQLVALHHGGVQGRYNEGIPMTALRAWFDEKGFDKLLGAASPSPGPPPLAGADSRALAIAESDRQGNQS